MTLEEMAYCRLMLLCGHPEEYEKILNAALEVEDPLGGPVLELSFCGKDSKKALAVLNEHGCGQTDSSAVFDLTRAFLLEKYRTRALDTAELVRLMYVIARNVELWDEKPWATMYLMGDYYDDALNGLSGVQEFQTKFEAFLNEGICFSAGEAFPLREIFGERLLRRLKRIKRRNE